MRHKFRLGRGARWLPALGATVALAAVPSVASASRTPFDPSIGVGPVQAWWNGSSSLNAQTTNAPYLAWNGEEIRLESCVPINIAYAAAEKALGVDDHGNGFVPLTGVTPSLIVEDWSGTSNASSNMAQVEPGTENVFLTDDYADGRDDFAHTDTTVAVCAEGDVTSEYPGLARVKMVVTANSNLSADFGELGIGSDQNLFKTQYLAGWMTFNTPVLKEEASTDFGDSADAAKALGDPTGNGQFTPTDGIAGSSKTGYKPGIVDVKVTGNIPVAGSWSAALGGVSSITLPAAWSTLAHAFATDSNPLDTTPYDAWDTSGDSANSEGHPTNSGCVTNTPAGEVNNGAEVTDSGLYVAVGQTDQGDNCYPGPSSDAGPFSSVIGPTEGPAVGPYDPVNSDATWIPDGDLNAQDAPMPAARVDVAIAGNTGGTDIGGVGYLSAVDKDVTFSRNFQGNAIPHNLYAPFYNEFIPATARGDVASGIDGAVITGDFPNFFQGSRIGAYHFWQTAPIGTNLPAQTACLNRTQGLIPALKSQTTDNYPKPSGQYDAAVYTDQNGEAQVQYNPGNGFYLDNNPAIIKNYDHGCDLGATFGKAIGTSAITATAKYPFQPGNWPAVTSNTVNKTVISHWEKTIGFGPKGPADPQGNDNVKIVEVHAQNIDGTYDAGEVVCFSGQGASFINPFTGIDGNGINFAGEGTNVIDPDNANSSRTCVTTDAYGNAAVEVGSSGPAVDVLAEFVNEGLFRDQPLTFGAGSPTTGGTPVTVGPPATTTSNPPAVTSTPTDPGAKVVTPTPTTTPVAPSLAAIKTLAKVFNKNHKAPAVAARVDTLRLVMPTHAQHYVLLRVASPHKTAKVAVTLLVRQGGKTVKVNRTLTVKANRTVKINIKKSVTNIKGARLIG